MQRASAGVITRPPTRPSPVDATEGAPVGDTLTPNQAARRERVIRAALDLAAKGGYDTVQMRDVAAQAGVALGTVYRYFASKDALLAAATVEWMTDLEGLLRVYPPQGGTTQERVMDVVRRALRLLEREPQLARALITALTAGDPEGGTALRASIEAFARTLQPAFAASVDPHVRDSVSRVLGHVLWSTLVCWANRVGDMSWVVGQLAEATALLAQETGEPRAQPRGVASPSTSRALVDTT